MGIKDVLLATYAPQRSRRLLVVVGLSLCVIWTAYVTDGEQFGNILYFDPSEWLTYLIGLIAAALVAPVAYWIFSMLPPLIWSVKIDWAIVVVGYFGLVGIGVSEDARTSGHSFLGQLGKIINDMPEVFLIVLGMVVGGVIVLKAIKWILVGSPKVDGGS